MLSREGGGSCPILPYGDECCSSSQHVRTSLASARRDFSDLAVFNMPATGQADGVEHAAIVSYEKHSSVEGFECLFQLLDRGKVEMIRWLIENEQVDSAGLK